MNKQIKGIKAILGFVVLLILLSNLSSCVLFIKKCPLPSCEIRKKHRHLLIFKDAKKEAKKQKKAEADSLKALADTIPKGRKNEKVEGEHEATYVEVDGQVLDEEGNAYEDPKAKKKRLKKEKKAAKKKAKADKKKAKLEAKGIFVEEDDPEEVDFDENETNKYSGLTEEEYKQKRLEEEHGADSSGVKTFNEKEIAKELKKQERKDKRARRKEERKARKGKKGQADYTYLYRSRITKWWRRDQNPKTGKYFKGKGDSQGNSTKKKWIDFKGIFKKK